MIAPYYKLGDLCHIASGGTPSRTRSSFFGGPVNWVKITDMLQGEVTRTEEKLSGAGLANCSAKLLPVGTVLISIFATIGRTAVLGIEAATNQAIAGVTPKTPSTLDARYLRYFLDAQRAYLRRVARGVAQPNINQSILKNLDLPQPPLSEQLNIVDILSRAESIVRLRRDAQKKAAELIPALFTDLFGDPATNAKGWPIRRVADFVESFTGGKNVQQGSEGESPFHILKVSAVTSGRYVEAERKPAPRNFSPPQHHFVRVGDMLFSRANTVDLVGATALVERTDGVTLLPDKLWRIDWSEPVAQRYMLALFQSEWARQQFGKLSSGTSASMRNISQAKLFQMQCPVAPFEQQKAFAAVASDIEQIIAQQATATTQAESTFNALLAQVFAVA